MLARQPSVGLATTQWLSPCLWSSKSLVDHWVAGGGGAAPIGGLLVVEGIKRPIAGGLSPARSADREPDADDRLVVDRSGRARTGETTGGGWAESKGRERGEEAKGCNTEGSVCRRQSRFRGRGERSEGVRPCLAVLFAIVERKREKSISVDQQSYILSILLLYEGRCDPCSSTK